MVTSARLKLDAAAAPEKPDKGGEGVKLTDFVAYMQSNDYVYLPAGDFWPTGRVNARIAPIPLIDGRGRLASQIEGKPETMVRGQKKFVAYYRVSTDKQGERGLGMAAQKSCVEQFVHAHEGRILATFQEVESGKRNDRPQLEAAIARSQALGATLLIAKLDRLSRNAAFLLRLQDTGVDFVACDMPDANKLTIGIMALIAQHEREAISTRTKEGLAIARQRVAVSGQKDRPDVKRLGNPNGARALAKNPGGRIGQPRAAKAAHDRAVARAKGFVSVLAELSAEGVVSANAQAKALSANGVLTSRGKQWTARAIINLREAAERA